MESRDFMRWFKKGFVYIGVFTAASVLAFKFFNVTGLYAVLQGLIDDPMGNLSGIFQIGLPSLIWAFLALPLLGGWFGEYIEKKIRK